MLMLYDDLISSVQEMRVNLAASLICQDSPNYPTTIKHWHTPQHQLLDTDDLLWVGDKENFKNVVDVCREQGEVYAI